MNAEHIGIIADARTLVEKILELADRSPGQPVSIFNDEGTMRIGVLGQMADDLEDDWFFTPVALEDFIDRDLPATA